MVVEPPPRDTISSSPPGLDAQGSDRPKRQEDEVLSLALNRLQQLFVRAQEEGHLLSDGERADLYEALLKSLLKIERTEIKRAAIKQIFKQEREERQRSHMIHLSLIWFLGICTGFALYFGLEFVSKS